LDALEIQNEKALLENKWIVNTLLLSCILCCQFQDLFQSDLYYFESSMTDLKIHVKKLASKLSKRPKKKKTDNKVKNNTLVFIVLTRYLCVCVVEVFNF
jgi:hypothetical protein